MKRDGYGRYLLPHPHTGKEAAWTRTTTISSTLADRWALEAWSQRNTVIGLGLRPDLYALAAASTPDDKDQLTQIVDQAQEAARASSAANLGTALHQLTQRIDAGETLDVPEPWRPDVDAYLNTLTANHLKVEAIEQIVVDVRYQIAGTFDRILHSPDTGLSYVADLKTGANALRYSTNEIAIQLAIYAGATHAWTGTYYQPMPTVSQDWAIIIWLPVSQGHCELHAVNLTEGRKALTLALAVRAWRKRSDLTTPYPPATTLPGLDVTDDW